MTEQDKADPGRVLARRGSGVAPLRVQVVSDLHVEVAPAELRLAPGADVLVVAGDTCAGVEQGFAWLREAVPAPTPIVAVAGNHEHYRHVLPEQIARGRAVAADHGIAFLENAEAVIGGVRFLGCTLWTDYALAGEAQRPIAMALARDAVNDHRQIAVSRDAPTPFLPRHAAEANAASRRWLVERSAMPFDGPTVIVTHHAPSRRSIHPRYSGHLINAAIASNLDHLVGLSGAVLWIHGHTHCSFDYAIGGTRVLCNPHGYGAENRDAYDPTLVVEVERMRATGGDVTAIEQKGTGP